MHKARSFVKVTNCIILLYCTCGFAFTAFGQVANRNLLKKYNDSALLSKVLIPKSQFHPFPNTPVEWIEVLPDTILKKITFNGEKALQHEIKPLPATVWLGFVRTGNRTDYEHVAFGRRDDLLQLVLAESVEGKGRFLDKILNEIWAICEESDWGVPAHIWLPRGGNGLPDVTRPEVDLFSAETASLLAWTDYLIGNELDTVSPLIRKRIYYEANKRVLVPISQKVYHYMGDGHNDVKVNNWDPWVMSNCIAANLLLEPDEQKRRDYLAYYMKYVDLYINGLGPDGGCEEGPGYWSAAAGCVFDALDLIDKASGGKITIYDASIIPKMASYIYKVHIGDRYFIDVADALPRITPEGLMMYRFGKAVHDETMMGFGSWAFYKYPFATVKKSAFHVERTLADLMVIKECARYPPHETQLTDVWISDIQLMAARSTNGFFVASHAGTNGESHNHNDVGDFVVYYNAHPVIVDVGAGIYTATKHEKLWYAQSAYHNLPVVNGYQQGWGINFAATQVNYEKNKQTSELSLNIAGAYPKEAGIISWQRNVQLSRTKDIVITDDFDLNKESSLTQTFMTVCKADISNAGKIAFEIEDGSEVYLDYDASFWEVEQQRMKLDKPEDGNFRGNWDNKDIYRILLKSKQLNNRSKLVYTIHI